MPSCLPAFVPSCYYPVCTVRRSDSINSFRIGNRRKHFTRGTDFDLDYLSCVDFFPEHVRAAGDVCYTLRNNREYVQRYLVKVYDNLCFTENFSRICMDDIGRTENISERAIAKKNVLVVALLRQPEKGLHTVQFRPYNLRQVTYKRGVYVRFYRELCSPRPQQSSTFSFDWANLKLGPAVAWSRLDLNPPNKRAMVLIRCLRSRRALSSQSLRPKMTNKCCWFWGPHPFSHYPCVSNWLK